MAKYAQNGFRMHLLQSRISKCSGGGPRYSPPTREGGAGTLLSCSPPLAPTALGSCLWHSTLPLLYKLRLLLQFFLRTLPIVSDDVLKLSQPAVIVLFAPMLMHLLQYILSLSYEQNRICLFVN